MASTAGRTGRSGWGWSSRLLSNGVLAGASALLLGGVLAAVWRGAGQWHLLPPLIWAHLLLMMLALALTPVMLLRGKGTGSHRLLGKIWVGAMFASAATSLFFKSGSTDPASMGVFTGDFSFIHILSVLVVLQVPRIIIAAREHRIADHERGVRSIVIGALLVAGFFTFPFGRLLGQWLIG
ncbi:DUF2306 domain-containing protein [Sandarakinorhabdus sp.]|uniref:DUF2306 domain-containing protein n=1 Tax=Sandarakinorhabdus sp. TaxID=1916663 RepID=UPI00286DA23E|nr:DUF2306 domain-containing protein [Sandarakinorhabdus sp.]